MAIYLEGTRKERNACAVSFPPPRWVGWEKKPWLHCVIFTVGAVLVRVTPCLCSDIKSLKKRTMSKLTLFFCSKELRLNTCNYIWHVARRFYRIRFRLEPFQFVSLESYFKMPMILVEFWTPKIGFISSRLLLHKYSVRIRCLDLKYRSWPISNSERIWWFP